jgi:orotate phosphoribosyltransferase
MNEEYTASASADIEHEFITFALKCNALKFGKFETKAGRISPYFFNAGFFNDGEKLAQLAQFYAQRVVASGVQFDMALPIKVSHWYPPWPLSSLD